MRSAVQGVCSEVLEDAAFDLGAQMLSKWPYDLFQQKHTEIKRPMGKLNEPYVLAIADSQLHSSESSSAIDFSLRPYKMFFSQVDHWRQRTKSSPIPPSIPRESGPRYGGIP